jgi:hypothetical protein
LTKELWGQGKVVVLDSGFCVLEAICELKKKGVFSAAVIKKRRYWPKHIKGDEFKEHFGGTEIGHADCISGTLGNVPFHIFCMQDAGYVTMFMSTYGRLEKMGEEARRFVTTGGRIERKEFLYPEVIANHYKYRGMVDSHNAKRHSPISLETTWATKSWPNRVFAFLLAVSEVNSFCAWKNDVKRGEKTYESVLDFRKELARQLVNNPYLMSEKLRSPERIRKSRRLTVGEEHVLLTLAKKTKFSKSTIVASVAEYPQFKCVTCDRKVRTYCRCTPGMIRCSTCFPKHYATCDIDD